MKHLATAVFALLLLLLGASPVWAEEAGKHLFILSGQSNMAGLNPELSFTPTVQEAFGKENVIVIKDAQGGQPIHRWYKKWKPVEGSQMPDAKMVGDLYDRLMQKVNNATKDQRIASVTFVWMQGESDASKDKSGVYAASMRGLIDQLAGDLGRNDVNFVIGRISDFGNTKNNKEYWEAVREAEVKVAEADPRGAWVDTDDLNDVDKDGKKVDGLHYTKEGYVTLGKRFAEKSIALVKQVKN